jgi:hypothetical protein
MNPGILLARPIHSKGGNMKLRLAFVFALIAGLSPALAVARTQTPSVRQHGSTFHDRSPHFRSHEPQPHH